MDDARRQTRLVTGASILVLLCTAFLAWSPRPPLASSLPVSPGEGAPFQAFVVFRRADCEGNLAFAQTFERPRFKSLFQLTGVLVDAAPDDPEVRSKLKIAGVTMNLVKAKPALRRALASLSTEPGPLLIVVDDSGGLRLVTVTPKSPSESRRFTALLGTFAAAEQ